MTLFRKLIYPIKASLTLIIIFLISIKSVFAQQLHDNKINNYHILEETKNLSHYKYSKNILGNKLYCNISINKDLIDHITKLIKVQNSLFNIKSRPYIIVFHHEQNSSLSGIVSKGKIVIKGDFNKDYANLLRVVAHELAHRYIGNMIFQKSDNNLVDKWFFEGFTEFIAINSVFYSGIINFDKYVEIINQIITEFSKSPVKNINYSKLYMKNLLDYNVAILNYNKGFLIALIIDEIIKSDNNNKKSLTNLLQKVIINSARKKYIFDNDLYHNVLKNFLSQKSFEKVYKLNKKDYLINKLLPKTLHKYFLSSKTSYVYNFGFDFNQSLESMHITGVDENFSSYYNGLRNGQMMKCYSFDYLNGLAIIRVIDNQHKLRKIKYTGKKHK